MHLCFVLNFPSGRGMCLTTGLSASSFNFHFTHQIRLWNAHHRSDFLTGFEFSQIDIDSRLKEYKVCGLRFI